jgi:hypothetical protein
MKIKAIIIISTIALFIGVELSGQDTTNHSTIFPKGITVKYGYGNFFAKDEYISGEKYSGTIPYFSFGWARKHNKYVYRLEMEYRNSDKIKNFNISTNITQFTLNQGFLYPLKKRGLFNKDLDLWLGPTTDFFFFVNEPNIAVGGFDYSQSFAALLSLGINIAGAYSLNSKFQIESSIGMSALSLGIRMVDNEEDDQSPVKLLTFFSGLYSSFDLGIRYYIFNNLSIKAGYMFELCRISAWNPLIAASDNLLLGLTYSF